MGSWNGLDIIEWPYTNHSKVLIFDARNCFGEIELANTTPKISINTPSGEERETFHDRIEDATEEELHALRSDLKAKVHLDLPPRLGIADLTAAIAIDISHSNGNYAMVEDSPVYHRPWCSVIQDPKAIQLSLVPLMADNQTERRECKRCRPERWDVEASMGDDICLGPEI